MECLILADFIEEYWNVERFDELVEVANTLHTKFEENGLLTISLIYDENNDISCESHRATLNPQKLTFVRNFEDSCLNIRKILQILEEKNIQTIYICGYPIEGVIYNLASALLLKDYQVYIIKDGSSYLEENAGEESLSELIQYGAFLVESEVVLEML